MGKRSAELCLLAMLLGQSAAWAEGKPVARIAPSGEFLELEQQAGGRTVTQALPLYHNETVRYFSAGIGLEERSAEYPAFPLKIVMTAGGKPFLAGVAVTIHPVKGGAAITIPSEQVEGPWLFVDLAPGVYDVTATYGDHVQRLNGIKVEARKQRVVYLRWAADHGIVHVLPE